MTARQDDGHASRARCTVHVVTTCTDRKTRTPRPQARARHLPRASLRERLSVWQEALVTGTEARIPAASLYAGDHWQVVRELPSIAPRGVTVRVWVCSAGYGLVELDTPVHPYAATFGATHPDAIAPRGSDFTASDWWSALGDWQLPGTSVRSVADLAGVARSANDVVLAVLSEQYLTAIQRDVSAAADALGNQLLLLSAGARGDRLRVSSTSGDRLADRLLPANAGLKALVGGAMQSLNARLARRALRVADEWAHDPDRLGVLFRGWSEEAPLQEPIDRARSDDAAIQGYVRTALREDPSLTHTSLLRALRASGRACEQFRFRAIFHRVRDELALLAHPRPSRSVSE